MVPTTDEIGQAAELLAGIASLLQVPGAEAAGSLISGKLTLRDLYLGRKPAPKHQARVENALRAEWNTPSFHRPAKGTEVMLQLVEVGLPAPNELRQGGWDGEKVAALMRKRIEETAKDPAHQHPPTLDAFEKWIAAGLMALLNDAEFTAEHAPQNFRDLYGKQAEDEAGHAKTQGMLAQVLRRAGGAGAVFADPEALSLPELQVLAANFGESAGKTKLELVTLIQDKAKEHAAFVAEINAISEQTAGLGNLKAAAKAAAENLDYAEVETLLSMVNETELNIAAQTAELRADNALLRGRVEDAYRVLCSAADSFGSVDPIASARRRLRYEDRLYRHGLRYGGPGMALSEKMIRAALDNLDEAGDAELWGNAQNALAIALADQGIRTGGEGGAALLGEAVAAYRAALRVRTEADHSVAWAKTQNILGTALQDQSSRTGGEAGAALLAEAMAAYRAALRVRTKTEHPVDWAMTQNNLGTALRDQGSRMGGEAGAALLAEAVAAYRDALRVRTEAKHPLDWAMTQNNVGIALADQGSRTGGEAGAATLAEAVAAYRAKLRVRTEADHPVAWAMTMKNIALAEERIAEHDTCADPELHLRAALEAATAALRVYDPAHMPYDHGTATDLKTRLEAKLAALEGGAEA